jgi:signal transduction histidine kinase
MNLLEEDTTLKKLIPVLTRQERDEILLYFHTMEKYQEEIADLFNKDLINHPVFGPLIKDIPKEIAEERSKFSNQLQKDALENENWEPYVNYQIEQGIMYAKMGLEFRSWYELITMVRNYLLPYLQKEFTDQKLIASINGLNRFMDIAMCIIAEAYLLEKKEIIAAEGEKIKQLNEGLEKRVLERTAKLEEANKEMEQFVYVASHDLQEPLRTISNYVGLIEMDHSEKLETEVSSYLKYIVNATSKMQNLIKDLLDYSRVGKNIEFSSVECNNLLEEVEMNLDESIKESNAKITSVKLPTLYGNETKLKQLFQNLLSNAIKFRRKDINPEIEISVRESETEYLFSIKDNGIGIEKQYIGKLFVIFQRLNNAEDYPGTGIGLATCKKIVTMHKGIIWVESVFGEGSTFYFTIPKDLHN